LSWAVSIPPTGAPALRRARAGGVARDRALLSPLCLVRTRVLAVATELPPPCARPTGALRPRALVREPRQCRTRRRARQSRATVPVPHATLARSADGSCPVTPPPSIPCSSRNTYAGRYQLPPRRMRESGPA